MPKGRESGMPDEGYWETFFNPDCVLDRLDCRGDVIEFGCGYGTFTVAAAQRARTVCALDIEPAMVQATMKRATEAGLTNVTAIQGDFVESGAPDASMDYAMLFNILHIEKPVSLLSEAFRVLRPGGTAGIIHWNYDPNTPRGPSIDIRPRPEQCRQWAEEAGFEFIRAEDLCCCTHHYGLVMRRP